MSTSKLCACLDSNQGPQRYKLCALTNWATGAYGHHTLNCHLNSTTPCWAAAFRGIDRREKIVVMTGKKFTIVLAQQTNEQTIRRLKFEQRILERESRIGFLSVCPDLWKMPYHQLPGIGKWFTSTVKSKMQPGWNLIIDVSNYDNNAIFLPHWLVRTVTENYFQTFESVFVVTDGFKSFDEDRDPPAFAKHALLRVKNRQFMSGPTFPEALHWKESAEKIENLQGPIPTTFTASDRVPAKNWIGIFDFIENTDGPVWKVATKKERSRAPFLFTLLYHPRCYPWCSMSSFLLGWMPWAMIIFSYSSRSIVSVSTSRLAIASRAARCSEWL